MAQGSSEPCFYYAPLSYDAGNGKIVPVARNFFQQQPLSAEAGCYGAVFRKIAVIVAAAVA